MSDKRCENEKYMMTNNLGAPITNDESSLTVGERGPVLLQDLNLINKLAHFDRERIPERVVHAKGAGAHGYFKLYKNMEMYTKAKVFNNIKKETPTFVRFSTVIGSKGSPDTARDPRGFAVKFYTEDGNYDLVGNNLPVFFIRDAIKFPDVIHAFKPSPDTNLHDPNRFWDFLSNTPESTHMITFLFSDKGTIKSFRTIPGFGVNTYVWVNKKGERFYIKYHWKPLAGEKNITRGEAEMLAGIDPDVAVKDLYDTLSKGEKVEYELYVQIMDIKKENDYNFDPLDATKTWPESEIPLQIVGKLVLTHPPKDFFSESEQAAFCPANLVPGIEASNDKLLQGRLFSYSDTQRHRLGTNFEQLPINMPKVQVSNNERDGSMDYKINEGKVNYNPNTLNNGNPKVSPIEGKEIPEYVEGKIQRKVIDKTNNFEQAGELYRSFSKKEQDNLISNLVDDLRPVRDDIQKKIVEYFCLADKEYGMRVMEGLGIKNKSDKR